MDELIKQVANYIINNRTTINETAGAFGKSVSSIKKYINDADKLQRIDFELYQKVKEVQKIVELNGQIAGGRIGKRSAVLVIMILLKWLKTELIIILHWNNYQKNITFQLVLFMKLLKE